MAAGKMPPQPQAGASEHDPRPTVRLPRAGLPGGAIAGVAAVAALALFASLEGRRQGLAPLKGNEAVSGFPAPPPLAVPPEQTATEVLPAREPSRVIVASPLPQIVVRSPVAATAPQPPPPPAGTPVAETRPRTEPVAKSAGDTGLVLDADEAPGTSPPALRCRLRRDRGGWARDGR